MRFSKVRAAVAASILASTVFATTTVATPASAAVAPASNAFNHALALSLRRQVGVRSNAPAFSRTVQREVAHATVHMTAADKADFITLVQAAQAQIKRGLSVGERQQIGTAMARFGLPQPKSFATLDPLALVVLPVSTRVEAGSGTSTHRVSETPLAVSAARPRYIGPPMPPTDQKGSSAPDLSASWYDKLGARLATVSYVKTWHWDGYSVTSAPRYEPPKASFTGFCIGCSFNLTWHDEFWYPYNGGNAHSGYANKIHFTIHQCFGVWLVNQCLADRNESWSLRLHNNGTYSAYY